jgi:hypothetical protein
MALKVEGIVDSGMHAEEALGRSSRLEALHLSGWAKRERNCPLPGTKSVCLGRNQPPGFLGNRLCVTICNYIW